MAVDRRTGKTRWRFDDAKGAISNLHYEPDRIWFADARRLYAVENETPAVSDGEGLPDHTATGGAALALDDHEDSHSTGQKISLVQSLSDLGISHASTVLQGP